MNGCKLEKFEILFKCHLTVSEMNLIDSSTDSLDESLQCIQKYVMYMNTQNLTCFYLKNVTIRYKFEV